MQSKKEMFNFFRKKKEDKKGCTHSWLLWKTKEDQKGQYNVLFCSECGMMKTIYLYNG